MDIPTLYGRNLAIKSVVHITDREQFNRLVRREYSRLVKNKLIKVRGKPLADFAMETVLNRHPEIWELRLLSGAKNQKGALCGYIPEDNKAYIAEALA